MNEQKTFNQRTCALLVIALLLFELAVGIFGIRANAAGASKSKIDSESVLLDLGKSLNFHQNDYPNDPDDYSIQVIQIAEGENGELYIYTYQPSHHTKDLVASKISISYGFSPNGAGLKPTVYDLELLSTNGVFDKYKVIGGGIAPGYERWYNIVAIYRPYEDFDDQADGIIEGHKSYGVGQQWYAYDENDTTSYRMNTFDTLEIKVKFHGFLRMCEGLTWTGIWDTSIDFQDVWFVAFDLVDEIAESIIDADVQFTRHEKEKVEHVYWTEDDGTKVYWASEKERNELPEYDKSLSVQKDLKEFLSVNEPDKVFESKGWFANDYTWKRIMKASEFVKNFEAQGMEFSTVSSISTAQDGSIISKVLGEGETTKEILEGSQWVFAYTETGGTTDVLKTHYSTIGATLPSITQTNYYHIEDMAILRIKYMNEKGTFDVGVVGDITTPDLIPDAVEITGLDSMITIFKILAGLVALFVIFYFFGSFLIPVLKILWKGAMTVFQVLSQVLWWLITLPFKLIGRLLFRDR